MLERLKTELLEKGATACLPRALTDEWLSYLSASAEGMLDDSDPDADGHTSGAACLRVVIHLVTLKEGTEVVMLKIPEEQLFEYAQMYRIELALEEVHRRTDMKYEPATLETILTRRDVHTWRDSGDDDSSAPRTRSNI